MQQPKAKAQLLRQLSLVLPKEICRLLRRYRCQSAGRRVLWVLALTSNTTPQRHSMPVTLPLASALCRPKITARKRERKRALLSSLGGKITGRGSTPVVRTLPAVDRGHHLLSRRARRCGVSNLNSVGGRAATEEAGALDGAAQRHPLLLRCHQRTLY